MRDMLIVWGPIHAARNQHWYRDQDWHNMKQWVLVSVPVFDQCEDFCITYIRTDWSRSCSVPSPGPMQCDYTIRRMCHSTGKIVPWSRFCRVQSGTRMADQCERAILPILLGNTPFSSCVINVDKIMWYLYTRFSVKINRVDLKTRE